MFFKLRAESLRFFQIVPVEEHVKPNQKSSYLWRAKEWEGQGTL